MQIKSIVLNNFRTVTTTEQPEKVNALVAPNGSGKTAFIDALRYAVTGENPSCGFGPGKNVVEITLEDGTVIERSFDKASSCRVNGKKVALKAGNEVIESITGVPTDHARLVASSELFDMDPEEFQEFLLKYTPEKPNADIVKGYFTAMTPDAEAELDLILPPMPDRFPLSVIGDICSYATDQRKDLKRAIAGLEGMIKVTAAEKPGRTIQEIEKDLLDAAAAERNAENAKRAQAAYDAAVKLRKSLEQQVQDLEQRVNSNTATPVPKERIAENRKARTEAVRGEKEKQKAITTLKANLDLLEKTLAGIKSRVCPFSGYLHTEITCTADMAGQEEVITTLISEDKELLKITEQERKAMEEKVIEADREYESLIRAANAYEVKVNDAKRLIALKDSLKKTGVPEKPAQPAKDQAAIRQDIQRFTQEKKNAENYAAIEKAKADIELMKDHVKTYDLIVKAFSPKGEVMSSVIQHYLSVFENAVNSVAASYKKGLTIRFKQDTGVTIFAERNGSLIPYGQLSTGEKMSVTLLIIDMLNQLTGLKLMVLDNVECLDTEGVKALAVLLQDPAFLSRYDHIFIAAVNHGDVAKELSRFHAVNLRS